jgi:hypothetical protein
MDAIFKAQDEQLTATGRTILEDRVELKRSSDITTILPEIGDYLKSFPLLVANSLVLPFSGIY